MSDDKRYDGDPSTPVYDRTTGGQPQPGVASGHDHLRRDDAVTDLGDQVGAYADITDPDATARDFSATGAPVVVEHPAHDHTGPDAGSGAADTAKAKAGAQQEKAAAGLRQVGEQLGSMADNADSGVAGELVRNLSGRAHGVAGGLEGRDPGSLLDDVKSYAARKPGTFIAIAAVSGLFAGRVVKALTADAKDQHAATTETAGGAASQPAPPASAPVPSRLAGDVGPVAGEYDVVTEGDVPGFGSQTPDTSVPTTWPGTSGTRA
jgi:hypothetical protein